MKSKLTHKYKMVKIKAIIFDWGGVLVKNVLPEIFNYTANNLGVTTDKLIPVYEKHQHEFLINSISEQGFWSKIAADLNIEPPDNPNLFEEALGHFYESRSDILELVKRLKEKGYLTGLLSDAEKGAIKIYFKDSLPLFDAIVFSSVVGVEKPDRKIYELILDELGVQAEESLFFDDHEVNIEGAKKLGINAYQFINANQVKKILEKYKVAI